MSKKFDISSNRGVKGAIDALNDALNVEDDIVKVLSFIGEQAVVTARGEQTYKDRTGNLRSSIGYVLLNKGKVVTMGTQAMPAEESGMDGEKQAKRLLEELRSQFPQGMTLVVCAGMDYAYYVENIHHLAVLSTARMESEELMSKLAEELRQ